MSWFFAPSAVAGGPTSALLTTPDSGRAAALHISDARYQTLLGLLGEGQSGQPDPPGQLKKESTGAGLVNVSWLVHDIKAWRTDQIYPSERFDVIWTYSALSETDVAPVQGVWRRVQEPKKLSGLLQELGLLAGKRGISETTPLRPGLARATPSENSANQGSASKGSADRDSAGSTAYDTGKGSPRAMEPLRESSSSDALDGWWWVIPGLALGAVLALLVRPMVSRRLPPPLWRKGGESGPRQQLLDG
ncbi:hypothetical protein [Streptomyces albipurpureus]|nr:hypothetical protein [Streptomyces sp. CWNU-1]